MRLRFHPGLLAFGALIALLFLHWSGLFPLRRPLGFVTRTLLAPLSEYGGVHGADAQEQELSALRATLRSILGETYEVRERSRADEQALTVRSWANERGLSGLVTARVVTQVVRHDTILFVLDHGTRHGIREGATVVMDRGMLVGRIEQADAEGSLVKLMTAEDHRFASFVDNDEETTGLVVGLGEHERVRMDYIPRDAPVLAGDIVLTSGIDPRVPQGLLIGAVTEVVDEENTPWKRIVLRPFIHPRDLRVVGVLPSATDE